MSRPDKAFAGAEGELLSLEGNTLLGWGWFREQPVDRAVIEILVDGFAVGIVTADIFDRDLLDSGIGDGCHGFVFPLDKHILEHSRSITAQFANLSVSLRGSVIPGRLDVEERPRKFLGQVRNHGDLRVSGWVWDPKSPTAAKKITFFEGPRKLAECVADLPVSELIEKGFGDGRCGFSLTLPSYLNDGVSHEIRAMVGDHEMARFSVIGQLNGTDAVLNEIAKSSEIAKIPGLQAQLLAIQAEIESTKRFLPRSFDFACYPHWRDAWGRPQRKMKADVSYLVVIDGDGELQRSLASLNEQQGVRWRALYKNPGKPKNPGSPQLKSSSEKSWLNDLRAELFAHRGLVTYLRAGDTLANDALLRLAHALREQPSAEYAYADSDGPDKCGDGLQPWCKPAWDPLLHLATGYASHIFACNARLFADSLGSLSDSSDLPHLALAKCGGAVIHVPELLASHADWPKPPTAESSGVFALLNEYLPGGKVVEQGKYNRVEPAEPVTWPCVSLIIPTRDRLDLLKPCVDTLLASDYPNLELVIADNDSREASTRRYLDKLAKNRRCRIVSVPGIFNYSRINNEAVAVANGDIVGLVNNDITAPNPGWLKNMVSHLCAPKVGAVGAKLLWPNGMVQHAGVVTGLNGVAGHVGNNWFKDDLGYFCLNQVSRRVGAATAACLLLRKQDYLAVGGLDEVWLQVNFNDVDLCLKLRQRGLDIVWTPDAELVHHESASRGLDNQSPQKAARAARETQAFLKRWGQSLYQDPHYSPNLNLDRYPYTALAVPPRKVAR